MASDVVRRQRPRDRKQQILAAAAELIAAEGFDQVSVGQIAAAVGITPGALYRHHAGKEDLLAAVLNDRGAQMLAAAEGATSLDDLLDRQARESARTPELGVLWARELRHLGPERRAGVVALVRSANDRYAAALRAERPGLDDDTAVLLAWAIQSVLASSSGRVRGLREADLAAVLSSACRAVARIELPTDLALDPGEPARRGLRAQSKRENLLAEAGRLFGERGYHATGLAEVGQAAGVTGPGVYSHFESKEALVDAALERAFHAAWIDLHAALDASAGPGEALDLLAGSYARFAHRQPYLVASLVSDPGGPRGDWRRRQREYVEEWHALVVAERPDLDPAAAQVLVRAALTVVGNLARMRPLAARPAFVPEVATVSRAVLRAAEL